MVNPEILAFPHGPHFPTREGRGHTAPLDFEREVKKISLRKISRENQATIAAAEQLLPMLRETILQLADED